MLSIFLKHSLFESLICMDYMLLSPLFTGIHILFGIDHN